MSSYSIATIEGIGPVFAAKLKAAGIKKTGDLLVRGKDPKGRKEIAAATGLDESKILKWTNMADLMRIKGVGEEYSELLEAAGVDTVKELRNRNAANLTKAMVEANAAKKLVRLLPSEKADVKWVAMAKELPPAITY
jgi:predicted flap endonuclease-1-like 5' DNA nuclease